MSAAGSVLELVHEDAGKLPLQVSARPRCPRWIARAGQQIRKVRAPAAALKRLVVGSHAGRFALQRRGGSRPRPS